MLCNTNDTIKTVYLLHNISTPTPTHSTHTTTEQSHKASGASGVCNAVTINTLYQIAHGALISLAIYLVSSFLQFFFSLSTIYNSPACLAVSFCLFLSPSPHSLLGIYIFLHLPPFSFCLRCILSHRTAMWAGPQAEENPLGRQCWKSAQVSGGQEGKATHSHIAFAQVYGSGL